MLMTPPPQPPRSGWHRLTTADMHCPDRIAQWDMLTNQLFPSTSIQVGDARHFQSALSWIEINRLVLADFTSDPHQISREGHNIAREDMWYEVNLQISGRCRFLQLGRAVDLQSRNMVVYDSQQPYHMDFPEHYRQMTLKVPRAVLRDRVPCLDTLIVRQISGHSLPGRLFYDMVVSLCDLQPAKATPELMLRLEAHVVDLLATALMDVARHTAMSSSRESQLVRAKAHILANLDDADLCPTSIARALSISVRSLYELFEGEALQVAQWIKEQRLERIRRDLTDPLMMVWPITTIALRRGFKDFSHFSRVFRTRYGQSPRAFRKQGLDG